MNKKELLKYAQENMSDKANNVLLRQLEDCWQDLEYNYYAGNESYEIKIEPNYKIIKHKRRKK